MNISDINLDFLYLNKGAVLGGKDPFWEKWRGERYNFFDFLSKEPLVKVIDLTVHIFKNKYPRVYFAFADINISLKDVIYVKDKSGYNVLGERFIERDDLKSVKKKYGKITEYESSILEGIGYEFKEPILNLEEIIDKQLEGKKYKKRREEMEVVYEVIDSPILRLVITSTTFLLEVNRDKWEFRAP